MSEFTNMIEAKTAVAAILDTALKSGRWMVIVSKVDEGETIAHTDRVTWNFPMDNVAGVLDKITEDLKSLTPSAPDHPPLPIADWLAERQRAIHPEDASDHPNGRP